ncbi:hypothetical protein [Enterococcus sp. C76]|uniref:hypothetical protein n=1 Tax=Enterococcus sp. C76 TaxID=3231334 RepID=UPI0034A01FF6
MENKNDKKTYMLFGYKEEMKSAVYSNPTWEKQLRNQYKNNNPSTPYAYSTNLVFEADLMKNKTIEVKELLFKHYPIVIEPKRKNFILWDDVHQVMQSIRAFQPENLARGADLEACFEMIMLEVAKKHPQMEIVVCIHADPHNESKIIDGTDKDSIASVIRYIYHSPELKNRVVFYDGAERMIVPWVRNPELWKTCVKDFGMDLRPVGQSTQSKGLYPNKSAQLTDLASRHHQKSLSDFITSANVQYKADDQLNNRQQNGPTKQNVRMNTRTEKPLVKVDSWENREGLKQETDKNQGKKRVGQLIKSWENRQDSNSGQVLDNRTQTTGIATLNSRKQRLNQLQEGATKHKSYLLGDKKHIIPNKNLSLSKTQPYAEF